MLLACSTYVSSASSDWSDTYWITPRLQVFRNSAPFAMLGPPQIFPVWMQQQGKRWYSGAPLSKPSSFPRRTQSVSTSRSARVV
eukprot:COSAG04_NODE_2386_length_4228_cov_5.335917_5_plen_84_part_00